MALVLAACGEAQTASTTTAAPATTTAAAVTAAPTTAAAAPTAVTEVPATTAEAASVIPQGDPVTIEFTSDHSSGLRGKSMQWALAEYAKLRPSVNVRYTPQPGDFIDTFAIKIAAGSESETALLEGGFFFQHVDSFTQINDVVDKHPDFQPDQYYFVPDTYTTNFDLDVPLTTEMAGPQFGMPYQGVLSGLRYNIDLFEGAGVDPPGEDWTWGSQVTEAAKQLTNPDGSSFGIISSGGSDPHQVGPPCWGYGGTQWYNPDGSGMGTLQNGGIDGMRLLVSWVRDLKVSPAVDAGKELAGEFGNPFEAGKVGMFPARVSDIGGPQNAIGDRFRWGIAPMPLGDVSGDRPVHKNDQPHFVTSSAQRKGTVEPSVDFLVFLAGPVVQDRKAIDRGDMPVWKASFETPEALAGPPEGMEWVKHTADLAEFRTWQFYTGVHGELAGFRGMLHAAWTGDQTVEQAAETAHAHVQRVWAENQESLDAAMQKYGGM